MKNIQVTKEEYDMIISSLALEINHLEKMKKAKINNSLRIHIENKLPKIKSFFEKIKNL